MRALIVIAQFFQTLQEFYFDICIYKDLEPRKLNLLYAHDAPADSFLGLIEELEGLISNSDSDIAYIPFQAQDGMVVCHVPDAARKPVKYTGSCKRSSGG